MSRPDQPKLLGKSENTLPTEPSRDILDRFENCRPGRDYWIHLDAPEFSSLCPVTGQPDSAKVTIRYRPAKWCVETKSLKFYLASWRNTAAFNEEVINTILDDLVATCEPTEMAISGAFGARGGISLTVEVSHHA
jgi:7-cyano-7-deazaguanine reductase